MMNYKLQIEKHDEETFQSGVLDAKGNVVIISIFPSKLANDIAKAVQALLNQQYKFPASQVW